MANYSDKTTEKELWILEKRLKKMYQQAAEELNEKWDQYVNGWDEEIDGKMVHHKGVAERYEQEYKAYQHGVYTKEQFDTWYEAQIRRGRRWEAMRDQMTDRMMKANEVACSYVNDKTPGIYTLNHNYSLYQIESVHPNVSFTLADENTIKRLASRKKHVNFRILKMDRRRDYRWNKTRISDALAQGILQGENPKKIARRFMGVMESNHVAAVRNARTAFTSAQNGGRIDSYKKASEMGIEIQKEWLATSDSRTRESHVQANGQRQPWDKPFQMGHVTLKYPGDPAGDPAEVYNCRCTVVPVLPKIGKSAPEYDEWEKEKRREARISDYIYVAKPIKGDAVTPKNIYNELQKSKVGRETFEYIKNNNVELEIVYDADVDDGLRGEAVGNRIIIYGKNTKSKLLTAQTIIHETKHLMIGSEGIQTQKEEVMCFIQEAKHLKEKLTKEAVLGIIKEVKELYPEYPWR